MKKYLILVLSFFAVFSQGSFASEGIIEINLSEEKPTIAYLVSCGLHVSPVQGVSEFLCKVGSGNVRINLPDNKKIELLTKSGQLKVSGGIVNSINIVSNKLNIENAHDLSVMFLQNFGIESAKFESWYLLAKDSPRKCSPYVGGDNKRKPRVSIKFLNTFDKMKPWKIQIVIGYI